MTLIALTLNKGYPVLIADILLSSTEGSAMPVPTYIDGTKEMFEDKLRKPIDLRQKLYIINDRLAIALGGRLDQMRTFLNRMESLYGNVNFDDDDLWNYIDTYPLEDRNAMFAIVLKGTVSNGDPSQFDAKLIGSFASGNSSTFDHLWANGSGTESFMKYAGATYKMRTDIESTDAFLAANLSTIGYFLSSEMLMGQSLRDLWGAGFEMIVFENGKFIKLRDYTVVVMWIEFGKNDAFSAAPTRVMTFDYDEDVLLIRAIHNDKFKYFAVPKINDDTRKEKYLFKEATHSKLIIPYLFHDADSDGHVYHSVSVLPRNVNKHGESPIVFYKNEKGVDVMRIDPEHDKDFFKRSMSMLKDMISKGLVMNMNYQRSK